MYRRKNGIAKDRKKQVEKITEAQKDGKKTDKQTQRQKN